MRFRRDAGLDTSQVSDRRGAGPMAVGGGGIIGLIVLVFSLLNGGGGGSLPDGSVGDLKSDLSATCQTGEDANQRDDCRIVAVVNSVQAYWEKREPSYQRATTVFFTGSTNTGCGGATSAVGPFYCPTDKRVYIDLGFYEDLRNRFGARGGPFAEAYVIAHEYGHHIENLRGVLEKARSRETGPQSPGVRVELQADCLAGMWSKYATEATDVDGRVIIEELTERDIKEALDAARAVGDDRIQKRTSGRVNPDAWTHGSAEQRMRWFMIGRNRGSLAACDTFTAGQL